MEYFTEIEATLAGWFITTYRCLPKFDAVHKEYGGIDLSSTT